MNIDKRWITITWGARPQVREENIIALKETGSEADNLVLLDCAVIY